MLALLASVSLVLLDADLEAWGTGIVDLWDVRDGVSVLQVLYMAMLPCCYMNYAKYLLQ